MNFEQESVHKHRSIFINLLRVILVLLLFCGVSVILLFYHLVSPSPDFPIDEPITIEPGSSVSEIVEQFEQGNYVRSGTALQAILVFYFDTTAIQAGTYSFSAPYSTRELAHRIITDGPEETLITVTFPEGLTVEDFADIADAKLPNFNKDSFLKLAEMHEGKLFPETYFVPEHFTDVDLFTLQQETYAKTIADYQEHIDTHSLTESEIITLASIIEREANTPESMKFVSSVFKNRLEINMPLQADASIEYVLDTPLNELPPGALAEELRTTDSPYNTYLYTGLPPTPIGNPGRAAIEAVLFPESTNYFYYITDGDGVFHFAETLSGHNANIARYLQ